MKPLSVHYTWAGLTVLLATVAGSLIQYQDVLNQFPEGHIIIAIAVAIGGVLTAFGVSVNSASHHADTIPCVPPPPTTPPTA